MSDSSPDRRDGSAEVVSVTRHPHAVLDLPSRRFKGLKIERLLNLAARSQPIRLLEVGTGSGGIAHYFGTHQHLKCEVDAVDVHDNRLVTEGYRYQSVRDTHLPFADATFDVVLSNHVIEHVGDEKAQRAHLAELHRVLRSDGVGYLAVPNRWMLVEPHYKLVFLSWLPQAWRTPYLRWMGKGTVYDCEPLQMRQLEHLFSAADFDCRNLCVDALRATFEIERPTSAAAAVLRRIPDGLMLPLRRIIPTLIYRFERR
ncbi:class I SAM-dependent methyltransferase [Rhodanobacter sp. AS-Z3]|uniref:class I SAM-dependent methyltransferase n=1 Tax=Rhodanobacter sp. AS-Z3 TaxID=3031330 RepID=UPI00247963D3|nr:class I SAM-dependent methyltransferase [Rhodanobacter sp. AS-Z3]WEN16331.1 class I SAM-dependent methyltransferase [Rhodanobacter sp. AS-Z3]